jgi:hypothetical protein
VCGATAAGIVFGAFTTHLVPDSNEAFVSYLGDVYGPDAPITVYPWAMMLIGASFILLLAVDRVLVTRGIEGIHDHHSHDHITEALKDMQRVALEQEQHEIEAKHGHASASVASTDSAVSMHEIGEASRALEPVRVSEPVTPGAYPSLPTVIMGCASTHTHSFIHTCICPM